MSLSVKYSSSAERKLRDVLEQMMSEAICIGPKDEESKQADFCTSSKVANLVGEVVQLVALCRGVEASGKPKSYEMHVYANSEGVEWQYFQMNR
ncbi:MAG: hypothetical protein KGH61_03800 [Candidatus Micrarchaeota archaeon]|nr:hypothetical protein [Candidatus Micrarchaeota archaeon]MDE1848045.1 hypothetical protein [Candidatus Micrarchaeota archaeon]MDE1864724.1 hypothetical protein [Candidatus Micrarchaeota archaeon]